MRALLTAVALLWPMMALAQELPDNFAAVDSLLRQLDGEISDTESRLNTLRAEREKLEEHRSSLQQQVSGSLEMAKVFVKSSLRVQPDPEAEEVIELPRGAVIHLTGRIEGPYYETVYEDHRGWLYKRYLDSNSGKIESENREARAEGIYLRLLEKSARYDNMGSTEFTVTFQNIHPDKTVKYVDIWATPYNRVGDRQPLRNIDHPVGRYTGPLRPGKHTTSTWELWHLNSTITCTEITRIEQEYMDGTKSIYVRDIPKVLKGYGVRDVKNDCSYKGN